jgi:hypothetical protein
MAAATITTDKGTYKRVNAFPAVVSGTSDAIGIVMIRMSCTKYSVSKL